MKYNNLLIIVLALIISLNYSCTKEFIKTEKSKVVVIRSKAFANIKFKGSDNSYTIKPDLSKIIRNVEESYSYTAEAFGTTSSDTQVGEKITWSDSFTLNSDTTTKKLETGTEYFFLFVVNNSSKKYGPITINYGNSNEITENILISNTGITYRTGYYKTHSNTKIRFYEYGNNTHYLTATAGVSFNFPNTKNQCVVITISSKGEASYSYKAPDKCSLISAF